jgi:Leucine-rich repeat (LRR) protein
MMRVNDVLFSEEKKDEFDDHGVDDVLFEKYANHFDDEDPIPIATASTEDDKYDEERDSKVWYDVPVHTADDGNCLPTLDEIHCSVYHENSKSPNKTSLTKYCTTKAIVALATIMFVLLIGSILAVKSSSSPSSNIAFTPTNHTEHFSKEYNVTMEYLVGRNISSYESLATYGTPQYFATSFIADDLRLSVPQTGRKSSEQLEGYIARYVLTLSYFSFGNTPSQNSWVPRMDFALSMDVCQWNDQFLGLTRQGVSCSVDSKLPVNLTLSTLISFHGLFYFCACVPISLTMPCLLFHGPEPVVGMNLHGTLPTEIGLLTSLQNLNIENNLIGGTIPTEICRLTNLTRLYFGQNDFRGMIPWCIGQLTKIERLYFYKNNLMDRLPDSMGELSSLQHLVVSDNLLSGDPSEIWNKLANLQVLLADQNQFSALLDDSFLSVPKNIKWLDLSNNDFALKEKKPIPTQLLQMSKLEVIDFSANRLAGTFPSSLKPNVVLKYLSLDGNSMGGGVHELTNLKSIQHLDVSGNEFRGFIPPEFGQLTNLRLLFLGDNDFEPAPIPSGLVNLTSLEDLSLRNSEIYGSLNASHLPKSLVYLDLGGNHLSGNVPTELGNLRQLEFLILNDNQNITGNIPTSITKLKKLRVAFFDGTSLTSGLGQICSLPLFVANNTGTKVVAYADCGRDGGDNSEVDCDCCTCCSDLENKGRGCSIPYQLNLRKDWSVDFQSLKFTVTNETVFLNRTH